MASDYARGYSKGYNTGSHGRWHDHKPPKPPDEIVAKLLSTLRELRDVCDNWCATLSEDDDFVLEIGPKIDRADEVLCELSGWLLNAE